MEKISKWKIVIAVLLVVLLGFNIGLALELRVQQDSLESQISQMHLEIYNHSTNMDYALNTALSAMQSKIEAGSSLLSDHSISLSFEDGRLGVDVSFTPKEISADETVFVVLDTGTGEQKTQAKLGSTGYAAHILTAPREIIQATVIFESPTGYRLEKLPELDVMKMLSFNCESSWVNMGYPAEEGGVLRVEVFSAEPTVAPPYLNPQRVQLVVQSDTGEEVGRVDAKEDVAPDYAQMSSASLKDQTKQRMYTGDLSQYMRLGGYYLVYFELQDENGLNYRAYVADFESDGAGFGGWSANGGVVTPDFGNTK